jgi:DNA-binding protein HU-beta
MSGQSRTSLTRNHPKWFTRFSASTVRHRAAALGNIGDSPAASEKSFAFAENSAYVAASLVLSHFPTSLHIKEFLMAKEAKPMTKKQIVDHLAAKLEMPKKTVDAFFAELTALGYKEAKKSFTFPGLGKLVVVNRKARTGRNPATGEAIKIPAKKTLKFRIAKAAKDAVLGPAPAKK